MSRASTLALAAVPAVASWLTIVATAQPPAGSSPDLAPRLQAEIACVTTVHGEVGRWTTLLRELQAQLSRATTPAARHEVVESIGVVEGRIRDAAAQLARCVPTPEPEPDATEEPAPAPLHRVSENLRIDTPSVGGRGRVEPMAIERALVPFGRALDACYEQLADRHAIVRGSAALHLDVRADGSVHGRQLADFALGDLPFQRCVRDALVRIDSPGRPAGGAMSVDVMITIGPEL